MNTGEFPGEEPQKTHMVVGGMIGDAVIPLGSANGVDVLETPPEAILRFKEVSEEVREHELYL
jgi:hypothetical protein